MISTGNAVMRVRKQASKGENRLVPSQSGKESSEGASGKAVEGGVGICKGGALLVRMAGSKHKF